MANLIELAKENAAQVLSRAYEAAAAAGALPAGAVLPGSVEIPKDVANGDYAANHAMVGAKALRMPPRKIADALAQYCDLGGSFFSSVSVAGPGFINFVLDRSWYRAVLAAIREEGQQYGHVADGAGRTVNVEFSEAAGKQLTAEEQRELKAVLKEDPRPAYQENPEREYVFGFAGKQIHFRVRDNILTVTMVEG